MSLNNRISIRDTYGARGAVVDRQDAQVAGPAGISDNSRPESTTETVIAETEKAQEEFMWQLEPVPEAEIDEWVTGESCGRHVIVSYCTPFLMPRTASRHASLDIA